MTRIVLLGPANSVHLQRWAAALAARGHALCVISQHRCRRELLPAAADVIWLPYGGTSGYILNALALRRSLSRWRPEILNVHYASGYGTTSALSGFRPALLSVWGSDVYEFPYQSALKGWLLRRNLRHATALASTSEEMACQLRRLVPELDQIALTPFGVDIDRFAPAQERTEGTVTVGIVKSLAPTYGVDLLLRAFAGLLCNDAVRSLPHACRLRIVGDGPQRADLEVLAKQLGIAAQTDFIGAVAHGEVPAELNRLDIYVAPSRMESFGVAVIEASACGLPVIVSDAGGLPEVVQDGVTGLVVPSNDVVALQAALTRLVLDAFLRAELGRRGRERVVRDYAWPHCVDLMERCYARTIARMAKR